MKKEFFILKSFLKIFVILIAVIIGAIVIITMLTTIPDVPEDMKILANAKIECLNQYYDEASCKADADGFGNFGGDKWKIACCWYVEEEACFAKKYYGETIPSPLENC